jgi:hypothetical protein
LAGGGNLVGIWFVELVSLFVSLLYIYKATTLFWSRDIAFFSVLSCLLFFINDVFISGNLPEEYSVPFISISLYYFVKFFKERKIRYTHFSIIAVCFVCVLLLKANGAISWLVGWIMVAFLLLKEKKMVDLWKVTFISLGISVLTLLPFFAYFYFTGSLSDFQYCYWDFNRAYSDVSYDILFKAINRLHTFAKKHYYVHLFLCFSALFFVVFNKTYKYKFPILFYYISFAATTVAISIAENDSGHYYLLYVPVLACFYAMGYDVVKKQVKSHTFLFLFSFLIIFHSIPAISLFNRVRIRFQKQETVSEIVSFITNHTQKEDKIYIVGNACLFYILSHRESASMYPYLWPIVCIEKYGDRIVDQFYRDIEVNRPKVICRNWTGITSWISCDMPGINAFLEKNYVKVKDIEGFECYLIKAK